MYEQAPDGSLSLPITPYCWAEALPHPQGWRTRLVDDERGYMLDGVHQQSHQDQFPHSPLMSLLLVAFCIGAFADSQLWEPGVENGQAEHQDWMKAHKLELLAAKNDLVANSPSCVACGAQVTIHRDGGGLRCVSCCDCCEPESGEEWDW